MCLLAWPIFLFLRLFLQTQSPPPVPQKLNNMKAPTYLRWNHRNYTLAKAGLLALAPFLIPSLSADYHSAIDIPKEISSVGTPTVTSTLVVAGETGSLIDVNVTLDVTHSYDADLDIFLIHPDGTRIELTTDNGGNNDHYAGTTFDQQAEVDITAAVAPFTGTFRPEGDLGALNDKSPNGDWKLEVGDDAGSDGGSLNAWSVELVSSTPEPESGPVGEGPGMAKITYSQEQVGTILSQNDTTYGNGLGINGSKAVSTTAMHRGYLFVPLGADHGGGQGAGGFAFYDVSDPANIINVFDSRSNPGKYHTGGLQNYVGDWAEVHTMSVHGDRFIISERRNGSAGFCIFDVSNLYDNDPTTSPEVIGRYTFPGVTSPTNYDGYSFSLCAQGNKYVYAPTGANGLYVVDISDPSNPALVKHMPKSELSNLTLRAGICIGNWLVLATSTFPAFNGSFVVMDISDPANPSQIGRQDNIRIGYQGFVYGSQFFGAAPDGELDSYDFSDPANITRIIHNANAPASFHNAEYGFAIDNQAFIGHYPGMTKWDLNQSPAPLVATASPVNPSADDYAFLNPLGNVIIVCSDHNHPNKLNFAVHQAGPDITPATPVFTVPKDQSTNVNRQSRVGISFSDFPEIGSLSTSSIEVKNTITNEIVTGSFDQTLNFVNFVPENLLDADATYTVVLKANGVSDWSGNQVATDVLLSTFSTGSTIQSYALTVNAAAPVTPGEVSNMSLTASNPGALDMEHAWDFGDGSALSAYSRSATSSHTYTSVGNHTVTVHSRIVGETGVQQSTAVQVVHHPLVAESPRSSSTIVHDAANNLVWNVNPDNNTVTAIEATTYGKVYEIAVGNTPKTLALGADNTLWVVNKKDATLSVINRSTGSVTATHLLPYASAPHAIVINEATHTAYVSLEGTQSIQQIDTTTGAQIRTLAVSDWPRSMTLDRSRNKLWVSHFISSDAGGLLTKIDTATFSVTGTSELAAVMNPDSSGNGRGIPNYLGALATSPDATQIFIPSKKDNIFRGLMTDGLPLTFEFAVRSAATRLDLSTDSEDASQRIDFDNSDFATAVVFSPLGNQMFFTTNGSATIWAVDAYDTSSAFTFDGGGEAPDGLAMNSDGSRLYVHNFVDRSVTIFQVSTVCASTCGSAPLVAKVDTVANEALSAQVLLGKQFFYRTNDQRLAQEGYMSCASCHLDGGHDGRNWDFTNFDEGIRNTIDLNGRGVGHGPLHWSANFDEVHDFEGQIRSFASGTGLMNDADFSYSTRSESLGLEKAGVSSELDALAAYVSSLTTTDLSPHRQPDGNLTTDAVAGKALFQMQNCASCHSGSAFTDSASLARHDVGTLTASSGKRLGSALDGLDTPTLRGLWKTAPYLHDGSAATLREVLVDKNISAKHGNLFSLTSEEIEQLVAYLQQIDDLETAAPAPIANNAPVLTDPGSQSSKFGKYLTLALTATDSEADTLSYHASGLPNGLTIDRATGVISGAPSTADAFTVRLSVRDTAGNSESVSVSWVIQNGMTLAEAGLSTGSINREYWTGISGTAIADLTSSQNYPNSPSGTASESSFEASTSNGSNFGSRMHGYLIPPTTGSYTFWIASDDNGLLSLSTNHEAANAVDIANVTTGDGWTNAKQWDKFASQQSVAISLQAGQVYYIRALAKQGNGGDNLAVAWQGPGVTQSVIAGQYLAPYQAIAQNQTANFGQGSYVFSIPENTALTTSVGTASATDPDAGQSLTYSITSGNVANAFEINPSTGEITVSGPLDYESYSVYTLQVSVTDDAGSALSASVPVTVTISNVFEDNKEVIAVELAKRTGAFPQHANPALVGFDADPDNDGIPNVLELLLGSNPAVNDAPAPIRVSRVMIEEQVHTVYEVDVDARLEGSLRYSFMGSSDLSTWSPLANTATQVSDANGIRTYRIVDNIPVSSEKCRFMRISLSKDESK